MAKGGFRGGMGGGNMMKQAQKMQEEFMKMQKELCLLYTSRCV